MPPGKYKKSKFMGWGQIWRLMVLDIFGFRGQEGPTFTTNKSMVREKLDGEKKGMERENRVEVLGYLKNVYQSHNPCPFL